jgi:predicted dehydrogenase
VRPLSVGVVGLGYGASHVAAFQACPDVEVTAVCARTRSSAEAVGERHGVGIRTTDYAEVLDAGVDAISSATPPGLHRPIALEAFRRGIHVLCEKPLAAELSEGVEMLAAAEAAGVVHAVNYDYRALPDHSEFHRLIADGYIGEFRHAHLHWMSGHHADETIAWGWRHSREAAGFGVLGDFSHILDDVLWNFGAVVSVCADLQTVVAERHDPESARPRRSEVEDVASFVLLLENGGRVVGQLSRCAPGAAHRSIECFGSEGMLRLTMADHIARETELVGSRAGGPLERLSLPVGDPQAQSSQAAFVAAIRSPDVPVPASFREGVEVLRLTEAMRASSESGSYVRLADPVVPAPAAISTGTP